MFSSPFSLFSRTLPKATFEKLCSLWQQMAVLAGEETLSVGEEPFEEERGTNATTEKFRLLVSPSVSALLLGRPRGEDLYYQVTLTFDPQAIADFLLQLGEQLQDRPLLRQLLSEAGETQLNGNSNLQSLFTLQLLEILAPSQGTSGLETSPYPRFSNYQPIEIMLRDRLEQERILNQVTLQIGQNQDLLGIVNMTLQQVQHLLQLDRLVIYQLGVPDANNSTKLVDRVTYQARATDAIPDLLNFHDETCFADNPQCRDKYRQGFTLVVDDVATSNLAPCLQLLMQRLNVKAKIVTPMMVEDKLWGFLIAHQCSGKREWKESDVKFLINIAQYLAIAIYQNQSYQQLQEQKQNLETQVKKRAEELQDALMAARIAHQSKSEFIGNISHELRTPLTCIIGLSNTLISWLFNEKTERHLPLEKQRQYLQTIQDSGQKLLELLNNILEFSAVEAGKSLLTIREFSLRHICRLVLQTFSAEAQRQEINLELEMDLSPEGDRFRGDRERVKQIVSHLINNGIKFTPAGGKVILRVWRENRQAVFQVEDTGIGIAEHHLPLLFEEFQQLENYRVRSYGGAGLGLALTKQLVELQGGRIEVQSTVDRGSSFTVWLPYQSELELKVKPLVHEIDNFPVYNKTIVLLEEDDKVATLICSLLTAANYQVVWLIDTSTAMKQIQLLQPTMVILDWEFTQQSLEDFSLHLQQLKNKSQFKLLMLVSRGSEIEEIEEKVIVDIYNWGADDYLYKPVYPNKLLEKVQFLRADREYYNEK